MSSKADRSGPEPSGASLPGPGSDSDPELAEPPRFEVVGGRREVPNRVQRILAWIQADLDAWARERSWEVRVPVLLFFAYLLVTYFFGGPEHQNFFFSGINLGFHEAGHALFRPLGEFMMIAGGTILQCLIPLIAAAVFWQSQRDYFGIAFCLAWLATNFFGCATYASDARGQLNLILVSPWGQGFGADGIGDWSRMLGKLGLLEWDTTIAFWLRVGGYLSFLLALLWGGYVLWRMHEVRKLPPPPPPEWAR